MSEPIIAAIDPGRDDPGAAALGALLSSLLGARLLLAVAYPVDPPVDRLYPDYADALRREAGDALARAREPLAATAPEVEVATSAVPSSGSPARALHELAEREGARALVLGSSARGPLGRVLPGAVTDRLLHGAPCPVAIAPAGYGSDRAAMGLRLLGAAFLERPDARAALDVAVQLARRARGRVRVLTVRRPLDLMLMGTLDPEPMAAADAAEQRDAEVTLLAGTGAIPAEYLAGGEVLIGRPAEALAAQSTDLDLLVCGSRGYGPARTLLLGGTSHALARRAACPVLVVSPRAPAQAGHPRPEGSALAI